jgi:glycosyltransferase involved in cell wall biosynthesis
MEMATDWICCQLGAREHYAIPRALHQAGSLRAMLTDAWVCPGSVLGALNRNLGERYHSELATAQVISWTPGLIGFELQAGLQKLSGWPLTMRRNRWFQRRVVGTLSRLALRASAPPTLFAYSYAALEPFRFARARGWRTVLGQIDPGPVEERLVERLRNKATGLQSRWQPAPEEYWRLWREECDLADHIVVNSAWSRAALREEGIAEEKIAIVGLAFDVPAEAEKFERSYPAAFSEARPLRVLFLGQVNLRKGMQMVLEAMELLRDLPIELSVVGGSEFDLAADLKPNPRIRWLGPVARSSVAEFYREADVFLFPTFSDGFGLTQLEAQAWKLPVIASRFCGDVVEHGRNGWVLPEVTAAAIFNQLSACLRAPTLLASAALESKVGAAHTLSAIGTSLSRLPSKR